MKNNLLLGNGVNIQFGGKAYSSEFIMKRMKFNALLDHYDQLFEDTVNGKELSGLFNAFVEIANQIKNGEYDDVIPEEERDVIDAVEEFKNRYTWRIEQPQDVMLEDWFLLLEVFILANPVFIPQKTDLTQGFERLILDAIYNDGKVQEIYKKMGRNAKRFFSSFDSIFTLNYDNNIERLMGKTVYHLHGDYSVLSDSENPDCVQGYLRKEHGERVLVPGWEHCFCNALLNYSGKLKLKRADLNHRAIELSSTWNDVYSKPESIDTIKKISEDAAHIIQGKIDHPELYIASEYHFDTLRNISGELSIIGISPNNDNHIFEIIVKNPSIEKIIYYYYSDVERCSALTLFGTDKCTCSPVVDLWKELKCSQKTYKCNYPDLPKVIPSLGQVISSLSDDSISNDKLIQEVNQIPQFELDRLTRLVDAHMKEFNVNTQTKEEFDKQRWSISHIALQEGIHPAVLLTAYIMNTKARNHQ